MRLVRVTGALAENDCAVNEREATESRYVPSSRCGRRCFYFISMAPRDQRVTLMPRRARTQKSGEGIIYRKWVVRRSGVI